MSISGLVTRAVFSGLAALPLSVRRIIGRVGGRIFSMIPTPDRKIAALQLDRFVPELGGRKLLPKVYVSVGQSTLESINLSPILNDLDRYVELNDWELAKKLLAKDRPLLVLSAHTGNWDLMAAFFIKHGIEVTTIGRRARNLDFQAILEGLRNKYGIKTIWRTDVRVIGGEIGPIVKVFSQNGVMAVLIDQDTKVTSLFVPFFGELARCPSSLVGIAEKYNARLCTAFCARLPSGKYSIRVKELELGANATETLTEFHRRLEEHIREFPDQWVWFHKRWRTLNDGRRLSTREYIEYLSKGSSAYANS